MDPKEVVSQRNLRNRVSFTTYTDGYNTSMFNTATFYSYDIHGNVDTLLQDYGISGYVPNMMNRNGQRWKKLVYRYDLISGKVNHVAYNPRRLDELYHRYSYDAENRLTLAETSTDSIIWERDARYEYYKHGPLARTVLGNELVQGLDYAYTLQGWLKGVNSASLDSTIDMGQDARAGGLNRFVTRDAIGFNLNYYTQDYTPIGGANPFPGHTGHMNTDTYNEYYRPLYNGNISSMAVNISKFPLAQLYNYKYDQLNRITRMDAFTGLSGNSWSGLTLTDYYRERVSYDGNGNILKYMRHGDKQYVELMDSLRYTYYPGSNKLRRVNDNVAAGAYFNIDVEDQGTGDNYTYDAIGNMTSDAQEGITDIKWTVYGKIKEITRTPNGSSPASKISYTYDAGGNRISKKVEANSNIFRTWYVRDAQGNVMATYTANGTGHDSTLAVDLQEQHIYGSSRLGILTRNTGVEGPWYDINNRSLSRGLKQYELTNHLGNVLTSITDKKLAIDNNADDTVDYYVADVLNAMDYYPFGMPMPGRTHDGTTYRYGFNGKENDNEVKGMGNQEDYGFRIYDPRIGKFLSVDPLTKSYPWYTPYQFAGNSPIANVDLDGLEEKLAIYAYSKDDAGIEHITYQEIKLQAHQQLPEYGNKGIFVKYYIQNAITGKTDMREAYETTVEVKKDGFWSRLFGYSEWLPQIQIFGSGSESFGGKVDPSKPLVSVNITSNELFDLLLLGRQGPEKYGPLSEVDKYEEAVKFVAKLKEEAENNSNSNQKNQEPITIEEFKPGKWNYYRRDKSGNLIESEYTSTEPERVSPGKDGAPDTIRKVEYTTPPVPKIDIPKKNLKR